MGTLIYLDVRNRAELQASGRPIGSVNVPLPDIERAFAMEAQEFEECYRFPKPPTDASNIVVGCLAGKRAIMAINKLRDGFGYTSLMLYEGSFGDWTTKGGGITK